MSGNAALAPVPGNPSNAPAPQTQADSAAALGGGGGPQDWGEALAAQQAILDQNSGLVAQQGALIESLKAQLEARDNQLKKLGQTLTGEPDVKPTPRQERTNRLSGLVAMLNRDREESLKQGLNGMPHTVKIGTELAQYAQEADSRADALEDQIKKLTERLDRQQNPMFAGLERAAYFMEGMVEEGLEALYGKAKETAQVRAAQYDAITKLINDEIKDIIAQKDFEAIKKIQRSPAVMRSMVNHFLKQVVPPKVREMMDAEELANQPDDPGELLGALREAQQKYNAALSSEEPNAQKQADFWSRQIDEIRQKFLAASYAGNKKGSGKPSINGLITQHLGGNVR